MGTSRKWVVGLVALLLVAAACGGEEAETTTTAAAEVTTTAAPTTTEAPAAEPLKVAFVHQGPVGEHGWNFRHNMGRLALEDAMGDAVETLFLESVPATAEAERVFEDLIRQGVRLLVTTSFDYQDQVVAVAEKYPEAQFLGPGFFLLSENVGSYDGGFEQGMYLGGVAAASLVEADEIGILASYPIPEVLRDINGLLLGARSVNPDATVQVVWTGTWFDPLIEGQAAESLFDTGVRAVAQVTELTTAGEVAQARGGYWIEIYDNGQRFAPEAYLTGALLELGGYFAEVAQQMIDGTYEAGNTYLTLGAETLSPGPYADFLSDETVALLDAAVEGMTSGELNVFTGPLNDQDGNQVLADGEVADLGFLLGMDFLLEGVIGGFPS